MKFLPLKNALLLLLAAALAACSLPFSAPSATQTPVSEPPQVRPSPTDTAEAPLPPAASETPAPTPTKTLTPEPQGVVITVNAESLNIRRGPGPLYNVVGILFAGQSATATARDSSGNWLYIPLPSAPSLFGWVAAQTAYATVSGDINSLPVVNVAAAEPIYIKNCTYHDMLINPGSLLLKGQTGTSAYTTQVPPGTYTVSDTTVNVQVAAQELFEGNVLVIYTDGLNNTYACP